MKGPDKYGIINSNDLENIIFSEVFESDVNSLRYSLDVNYFVIKWNTESVPSFITSGEVIPSQILNHSEAINLMSNEFWETPIDPDENYTNTYI